MYRVVRDRERRFQVLMGEDYKTDEYSTDQYVERVLLLERAVRDLAFNLEVYRDFSFAISILRLEFDVKCCFK